MRALGVDLGDARIGIAVSDSGERLASPVCAIDRAPYRDGGHRRIVELVAELEVEVVVVGLPLSLDGARSERALLAEGEARALAGLLAPLGVEVETFDERLTTVAATRAMRSAAAKRKAASRDRGTLDQAAAALILQGWLDLRRARSNG